MITTRRYFEEFLDLFDAVCALKDQQSLKFVSLKKELVTLMQKNEEYNILFIPLPKVIFNLPQEEEEIDLRKEQSELALYLYVALLQSMKNINVVNTSNEPNYAIALEYSRTKLPFDMTKIWKEKFQNYVNIAGVLGQNNKAFDIKTDKQYQKYRRTLYKKRKSLRFKGKDKRLTKGVFLKLSKVFKRTLEEYRNYIFNNYPSIADQFSYYNKKIRLYFYRKEDKKELGFSVLAYKTLDGDTSPMISDVLYNFVPKWWGNFEETSDPLSAASSGTVNVENPGKSEVFSFSEMNIHTHLASIFLESATENDIVDFFKFFYKCKGFNFRKKSAMFDVIGLYKNERYCFQMILREPQNIKTLESKIVKHSGVQKKALVFISKPDDQIFKIANKYDYTIIEMYRLIMEHINNDNSILLHWYIKSKLKDFKPRIDTATYKADQLLDRLQKCKPGVGNWSEYERICCDIFEFLFADDFKIYTTRYQSYDYLKIQRRDLLINNTHKHSASFWAGIKQDFDAKIIIIDFKNYKNPLEQNEFYLPSKYLLHESIGRFGIIVSRKGISESSTKLQQTMLREKRELLISLNDTELKEMVREKVNGVDPTYRLDNKLFILRSN